MFEMYIKSAIRDYKLKIIENFGVTLKNVYTEGDFIIFDKNVLNLYKDKVINSGFSYKIIEIDANEEQKSYLRLAPVIEKLIEGGFKKNNSLIAIGGGITQDVTAFISSILYRGVDWVFFPTTLLAQCDSCIGSKTSINFGKYKNQIGNFYPPGEIFIDLNFLKTLA